MSKKRRSASEDVLELRDLASARRRAMLLGLIGLAVVVWALSSLIDSLGTSLDQQEELSERLERATDRPDARPPATARSSSEPPTT